MSYNLFIAYDLRQPGQNYDLVRDRIESLGSGTNSSIRYSMCMRPMIPPWHIPSVLCAMDGNDRLAVINCADWLGAIVTNWDLPLLDAINTIWSQR